MWCWRRSVSTSAAKSTCWGLREGATENAAWCKALLADLVEEHHKWALQTIEIKCLFKAASTFLCTVKDNSQR
jgi:hypothetical protein